MVLQDLQLQVDISQVAAVAVFTKQMPMLQEDQVAEAEEVQTDQILQELQEQQIPEAVAEVLQEVVHLVQVVQVLLQLDISFKGKIIWLILQN